MKVLFMAVLFGCCYISAYCQNDNSERTNFINQIRLAASQQPAIGRSFHNIPSPALKIPADFFLKPDTIKPIIKHQRGKAGILPKKIKNSPGLMRPYSPLACKDTSYRRLIGVNNG